MALIDKPERARQLARAIASDVALYHDKKLIEGVQNDTLFDSMSSEIEEGRALFKTRVTPEVFAQGHYERALCDVMLKPKASVKSRIW
jgi:hypothetical protein